MEKEAVEVDAVTQSERVDPPDIRHFRLGDLNDLQAKREAVVRLFLVGVIV